MDFIYLWLDNCLGSICWIVYCQISRGRTIRQFVVGVMLVPTLFTFLWFSVFGDTALHMVMVQGYEELIKEVQTDKAIALFKLYERLPFTQIVSFITVILIITFL